MLKDYKIGLPPPFNVIHNNLSNLQGKTKEVIVTCRLHLLREILQLHTTFHSLVASFSFKLAAENEEIL